jgi:DNA topoisomerase-2
MQAIIKSTNENQDQLYFNVEQKTDKQHILDNPDTYIGSVESVDNNMWIMDETNTKIIEKNIHYIPGLFKLFDEGIVNCRDHVIRMNTKINTNIENSVPVSYIDISIKEDGTIIMMNDGNGIDVVKHPEYKLWVPELIFGHLRTSTNYNKEEKKIVGGKNGFGFKLVLIWSTYGQIETVDHIRGLKYTQDFNNNLNEILEPKIVKATKTKPYTKITFKPDYKRLGINGLTPDMISLLQKRVYDISAITDKNIKVKYNGQIVPIKTFEQYIPLYIGNDKVKTPRVYENDNERWEYAVALSPTNEFIQVSFVNGIYTSKGGKHVDYILNQITKKVSDYIEKKKKLKVNVNSIKEQLILFIRCDIENPAFDSQTKDYMNTPVSKFGSVCSVSDKFIEKIAKMGVMDLALQLTEIKDNKTVKKTDGIKSRSIKGIPKLDDANWAGTEKSKDCMLILCEGDSAKTGVISGLSSEDRNCIGVYPLKGKVMNVRGETKLKISENKEIGEIKKILGLEAGKEYKTIEDVHKSLRYSKVVFMTDQDLDGSHIKGLCINLFQNEWASLTHINGFIGFMNTPILIAKKGNKENRFYNEGEYNKWKDETDVNGWNVKYYKGLGTSSKTEFKQYFQEKKFVGFEYTGDNSDNAIDMVFNKKRSDDRKSWLENIYDRKSYADTSKQLVPYEEFINKELIHYSKYDCDRSIPNLIDGLKISLRKILYSSFKKRLTTEIKVAQFSGYVSEQSGYHHGEESLNKAIVGMAQNFVGSNNINLLFPSGQFGSRIKGGQDASSPRYIFTRLEKITRLIYPEMDDPILNYLNDDGMIVEPQFYAPIIPMILVNGSKGIGTGFSTEIMCYNPKDIIQYLKDKLDQLSNAKTNEKSSEFFPYYEGFKGNISKISDTKFLFVGKYEKLDTDKIKVTELPIGYWTDDFKELLNDLQNDKDKEGKKIVPIIKEVYENYTDVSVEFIISFTKGKVEELEGLKGDYGCNGLEKCLKLYNTSSTTNMNLFNAEDKLKKYNTIEEIIEDYYITRLEYYQLRKDNIVKRMEKELLELTNKKRFIEELLVGSLDLRRKKKEEIVVILNTKGYNKMEEDSDYKYLIKMPMDAVTQEKVDSIVNEFNQKTDELVEIKATPLYKIWLKELEKLEKEYEIFIKERKEAQFGVGDSTSKGLDKKTSVVKKVLKIKKQNT